MEEDKSDSQKQLNLDDDWSEKYNIALTTLQQEYLLYINTLKDVDEKSNKYLIVISIFIAGFFSVISSALINGLRFHINPLDFTSLLSIIFIVTCTLTTSFAWRVINNLLNSLSFVESRRLFDLESKLNETSEENSIYYKKCLINSFQEAINFIEESIKTKQQKLNSVPKEIRLFILFAVWSCILLFVIKMIESV
ncbi:TPA: hypothetical protein ACU8BS_001959 [Neisseria subflava]